TCALPIYAVVVLAVGDVQRAHAVREDSNDVRAAGLLDDHRSTVAAADDLRRRPSELDPLYLPPHALSPVPKALLHGAHGYQPLSVLRSATWLKFAGRVASFATISWSGSPWSISSTPSAVRA